jgi:hypothetical protein
MVEAPHLEFGVRRHLGIVLVKGAHDFIIVALRVGAATAIHASPTTCIASGRKSFNTTTVETASDPHAVAHVPGPIE